MLVLDKSNSSGFASMTVKVTDNTVIQDDAVTNQNTVPAFNVLIPTVQDVGPTNTLELYRPGEPNRYINTHGKPNALKYGFGPDIIMGILNRSAADVGVYTINLRGDSAVAANVITVMKYKVEKDAAYTDDKGNPYYVDANGQLSTSPTSGTAVVRDVLHVKFENVTLEGCKKWSEMYTKMDTLYTEVEDDNGYKTIPLMGVMYRGAGTFGNNVYFNMTPRRAEYDGNMYYALSLFDGMNTITTDYIYSLHMDAGAEYNTSYFIETLFNDTFTNVRLVCSSCISEMYDIFDKYLYTLEDYIAGNTTPSQTFAEIDPFAVNEFAVVLDEGSINSQAVNAFVLAGGDDGSETPDDLYEAFFRGEILTDIASVLRYKIHYIPDVCYNQATKDAILDLIKKRNRMTSATFMVGGEDTFTSALVDHQAHYYEAYPNMRQIARVQSPMRFNEYCRRTMKYPPIYFDTIALMEHFAKYTHYFQPFAGADARWTDYIEDTMVYPTESVEFINSLYKNRVNCVMKDDQDGAYLNDQQMCTVLTSDQTEFNNAFLISSMLYDLLDLVHKNHFKFNEAEEVRMFDQAVNDVINTKYAIHSASISCEVYRVGTIGRAKSANKIVVTIDMKDINKFTDVELILTDD